jgi:hypothetical protein
VRLFSQSESELFESLFHEELQPVQEQHFAEVHRIHYSNVQHKLNLLVSEHKKFKREYLEARVAAYVETCEKTGRCPDRLDCQEFAAELTTLVRGGTDDIVRAYKDPLGPIRVQSLERTMEVLDIELGQLVAPTMAPLMVLASKGKLGTSSESDGSHRAAKRMAEFVEYLGRECETLGDLDWSEIKSFADTISTTLACVDFLREIEKLPDDGVVNNTLIDPGKRQRNTSQVIRPLQEEIGRLLSEHFDIERILEQTATLPNNGEELEYLSGVLRDYKRYHPTTLKNSYFPNQLAFCEAIQLEIQCRRDKQLSLATSAQRSDTINIAGDNFGPVMQGGQGNVQNVVVNVQLNAKIEELVQLIEQSDDLGALKKLKACSDLRYLQGLGALEESNETREAARIRLDDITSIISLSADLVSLGMPILQIIRALFGNV